MPNASVAPRAMSPNTVPSTVAIVATLLRPLDPSEEGLGAGEEADDEGKTSADVVDGVKPDMLIVLCDNDADTVDVACAAFSVLVLELAGSVAPLFVAYCP